MENDQRVQFAVMFLKIFGVLLASAALCHWRRNPVSLVLFYASTVLLVMMASSGTCVTAFLLHYTRDVPDWALTMLNTAFFTTWILIPLLWVGHLGWILTHHRRIKPAG